MSKQSESLELAILSAGANPQLQTPPIDATTMPTNADGGYDVGGSLSAVYYIGMRRDTGRVCTWVVDTFDAATTYTIDIGATGNASVATPADIATLLTDMKAAIDALVDGSGDTIATAVIYDSDGDGTNDALRITGATLTGYPCTATLSGGSSAVTVDLDPDTATVTLYGRINGVSSLTTQVSDTEQRLAVSAWALVPSSSVARLTTDPNYLQTLDVRGYTAFRPFVSAYAKHASDPTLGTASGVTTTLRKPVVALLPAKVG